MTPIEVGVLIDRLGVAYNRPLDPDLVDLWAEKLAGVPADVAVDAAENLIGTSIYFPTLAQMTNEVAAVHRDRAREQRERAAADAPCSCENGWVLAPTDNFVAACTRCPLGIEHADCVERYRAERAKQRRRIKGASMLTEKPTDPVDAQGWISEARNALTVEIG